MRDHPTRWPVFMSMCMMFFAATGSAAVTASDLFVQDPRYAAGDGPTALVAVDLDLDGIEDLLTANADSDDLSVFLGNPDGSFQPSLSIPLEVAPYPNGIAVGHFDSGSTPDLVVVDPDNDRVNVLLGLGDGSFQAPIPLAIGGPMESRSVIVVDINADTHEDVIAGDYQGARLSVFLGNGDGTFQPPVLPWPATWQRPMALAAGYVDADAHLDVVAMLRTTPVSYSLMRGNGDGTFQPRETRELPGLGDATSVVLEDFNGDAHLDMASAHFQAGDRAVIIHLGNGDGSFQPWIQNRVSDLPGRIEAAHVDGDALLDLIVPRWGDGEAAVLLGNGDGTFEAERIYKVGRNPRAVIASDFDNDGLMDFATANFDSDDVSVLLGQGGGDFPQGGVTIEMGPILAKPAQIIVAALDGDSTPDLAMANERAPDRVSLFLGVGNGSFGPQLDFPVNSRGPFLAAADLNHDLKVDLVQASRNDVSVLLGNGDGTVQSSVAIAAGDFIGGIATADVNGDDNLDLVLANGGGSGTASLLLGQGDGSFAAETSISIGAANYGVGLADLDGDTHLDLVVASTSPPDIRVQLGNGDGTFEPTIAVPVGGLPGSFAIADLDGDSQLDIVVSRRDEELVSVLAGNGDGTFAPPATSLGIPDMSSLVLLDVSGDGHLDLVGTSYVKNMVGVLLGHGDGTFADGVGFTVGHGPTSVAVADLDGDGFPDLITTNSGSDDLTLHLNRRQGPAAVPLARPGLLVIALLVIAGVGAARSRSLRNAGRV